jgi:ubiquinone/menaquinone biosynthesis C-methylase UbiE
MWILDVSEAWVVELKDEHLNTLREDLQNLERLNLAGSSAVSGCMDGRSIRFIVGDMTRRSSLPSSHLDLAYCEDTLYEIHLKSRDLATVQSAVNEMTRVVKPGGWIIAWDTKIGRRRQQIERQWVPVGDPIDISPLFQAAGLVKACLEGAPKWSYCYKKPNRPAKQITGGSKCHVSSRPSLRPIIKR